VVTGATAALAPVSAPPQKHMHIRSDDRIDRFHNAYICRPYMAAPWRHIFKYEVDRMMTGEPVLNAIAARPNFESHLETNHMHMHMHMVLVLCVPRSSVAQLWPWTLLTSHYAIDFVLEDVPPWNRHIWAAEICVAEAVDAIV
jgi:hypothetical protein